MLSHCTALVLLCTLCVTRARAQDILCPRQELQNIGIQAVQQPSTVLDQYYNMTDVQMCYDKCCQLKDSGCNVASFVPVDGQLVCMLLKCDPLDYCVTGEYISGRLAIFGNPAPAPALPPMSQIGQTDVQPASVDNVQAVTETLDTGVPPAQVDPLVGGVPDQALQDPAIDENALPDQAINAPVDNIPILPNEAVTEATDNAIVVPDQALAAPVDDVNIVPDQTAGIPVDNANIAPQDVPFDNVNVVPDQPSDVPVDNVNVVPDQPSDVPFDNVNVVPDQPSDVPVDNVNVVPDQPSDVPVDNVNIVPDQPSDVPFDNVNVVPDQPSDVPFDNVDVVPGQDTNIPSENTTSYFAESVSSEGDSTESPLFPSVSILLDQSSGWESSSSIMSSEDEMMSTDIVYDSKSGESRFMDSISLFPSESLDTILDEPIEAELDGSSEDTFVDSLNETAAQNWTGISEIPHELLSDHFASTWLTSEGEEDTSSEWPLNLTLSEAEQSDDVDMVESSSVTDEWLPDIAEAATTPTWEEWFWGEDDATTKEPSSSEGSDEVWDDDDEILQNTDVDQFPTSSQSWPSSSSSNWFSSSSSSGLWGSELETSVLPDSLGSSVLMTEEEITVVLANGEIMSAQDDFEVPESYPTPSNNYIFTPLIAVGACAGVVIVLLSLMFLSRRMGGYRSRAQYKPLREVRDPHMSTGKKYYDEV